MSTTPAKPGSSKPRPAKPRPAKARSAKPRPAKARSSQSAAENPSTGSQANGHASGSDPAPPGSAGGAPGEPHIIVTTSDFERLQRVVSSHDGATADKLDAELERATVVEPSEVPKDVVTMNSEVVCEDAATGAQRTVRIVYPEDADAQRGRVSVLAPLGSALLGLGVGQEIEWRMPHGVRRLRVIAVPYQPEASGHFHL